MRFHPLVQRWFREQIGTPTEVQEKAWTSIATRRHVLITAPTGSGKTLAAFLWAVNQLISGRWTIGETKLLYVSPLKALNNDIQKNLLGPLAQLRQLFTENGNDFPALHVLTRSGDTPSSQRRQMIRRPPEILITTPESLHLMLSSQGGRSILGRLRTVVMDEIHAVVGTKRGTLLISAVDRLVQLCGEFQRIALSATVNPIQVVADFVGGFRLEGDPVDPIYRKRIVELCQSTALRRPEIDVLVVEDVRSGNRQRSVWEAVVETLRPMIARHHSTLLFVNSRRLCEKLTYLINGDQPAPIAHAHHGSLSKELRLEVEDQLKKGRLRAIVATASLELGIDIGSLDRVILVQSPPSVSAAIQRIGRSGHGVGQVSSATFFPTHAMDALDAAVLARAVLDREVEPVRPVRCPLDVLAQVLVSMVGTADWDLDACFRFLRASYPFRDLQQTAYRLVVDMLAGRYAATQIPSLKPKIAVDRLDNTMRARKGALLSLYTSGGVIPDRGYFSLRHRDSGARIGELDEEFVWEAKRGQVFTLGTQNWRIERITHSDVFVLPAHPTSPSPPFWRAEAVDRDFHLSTKVGAFLEWVQQEKDQGRLLARLTSRYRMDPDSARFLLSFLQKQGDKTGCALPHRHHLVVEQAPLQKKAMEGVQVVILTLWGAKVNRPFALALEAAWELAHGVVPSTFATNHAVYLQLPAATPVKDVLRLVHADNVDLLLRRRLEGSGLFGARFRECAARALLLPRKQFDRRQPLWLTRQQAKALLKAVGAFDDFPILLEAWRSVLQDDFDLSSLFTVLKELESGRIAVSEVRRPSLSPMALDGAWRLINRYMYADDRQRAVAPSDLSADLLEEVVFDAQRRPTVDPGVIEAFVRKRQRLYPGYAPDSALELLEWVKERLLIPANEWKQLLERVFIDHEVDPAVLTEPIREKVIQMVPQPASAPERHLIVAAEVALAVAGRLYAENRSIRWFSLSGTPIRPSRLQEDSRLEAFPDAQHLLCQWLGYYGPLTEDFLLETLGLNRPALRGLLAGLAAKQQIVSGALVQGRADTFACHAQNVETMLRMARRSRKPEITPRDLATLSPFLARYQGACTPGDSAEQLAHRLQQLMACPLPATLWETEVLPARLTDYDPRWLDRLLGETGMLAKGIPLRQLMFCHEEDLDLVEPIEKRKDTKTTAADLVHSNLVRLFPDQRGRYALIDLMAVHGEKADSICQRLWDGFWRGIVTTDAMPSLRQQLGKKRGPQRSPVLSRANTAGTGLGFGSRRKRDGFPFPGGTACPGTWRLIPRPERPKGLIEREELARERVRLLMDRYGIVFRQLLARELPVFQWSAIFRALRLMELSGEVVAGHFFRDISGLQFASQRMLRLLQEQPADDVVFWIHAQDPASACGLRVNGQRGRLPRRAAGTHLVYVGQHLAVVSRKKGRDITFYLSAKHDRLADCLAVFDHLLGRRIDPLSSITVETINGKNALHSPYLGPFKQRFDLLEESNAVTLYQKVKRRPGEKA